MRVERAVGTHRTGSCCTLNHHMDGACSTFPALVLDSTMKYWTIKMKKVFSCCVAMISKKEVKMKSIYSWRLIDLVGVEKDVKEHSSILEERLINTWDGLIWYLLVSYP